MGPADAERLYSDLNLILLGFVLKPLGGSAWTRSFYECSLRPWAYAILASRRGPRARFGWPFGTETPTNGASSTIARWASVTEAASGPPTFLTGASSANRKINCETQQTWNSLFLS